MQDIYLGLVVMASLELGILKGCLTFATHRHPWQNNLAATAIVLALLLYSVWLWDNPQLVDWLPFSNFIVLANWFPLFFVALAGIIMRMEHLHLLRRVAISAVAIVAAGYAAVHPLLGSPPQCGEAWTREGDCVQTTDYTCSAASAATLLRAHGIPATEQEMSELCLTRNGTSWRGLYRGLKLKTAATLWDVEIVECHTSDLRRYSDRPMILDVGLPAHFPYDHAFRREYGWQPGLKHSVVMLGYVDSFSVAVSDPAPHIGRETWNTYTLNLLWRGRAIRLVERWPIAKSKTTSPLLAAR